MPQTPSFWTVLTMLEWATEYFEEKNVPSPRLSIEWLLAYVLSLKRLDLYVNYDRPLSTEELKALRPLVKRRTEHEPLQYITGETDFHHAKIKVQPGVLIPRPETEELVEIILQTEKADAPLQVLDIGTGSGCIPVALKMSRPNWEVTATDISTQAMKVAHQNAENNSVAFKILQDDILNPNHSLHGKYDVVISNPPYILKEEKKTLDKEVVDFEPEEALFCTSIEDMYGAIEKFTKQHLKDNGTLYLELHHLYASEVLNIFSNKHWNASLKNDYSGKSRFLLARHC